MNRFVVRIVLYSASEGDYSILHGAMEAHGFSRYIQADNGLWYQMPRAEYYREDDSTFEQVVEHARSAAYSTGKTFSVFGSHTLLSRWIGLPTAS